MNITLRPWREADAAACAVLADDEGVAANLRDVFPHPYTEQNARDFIALCLAADPDEMLSCVVEVDGAFAGSISLTRGADVARKSAELGYWFGRPFWGKGIATEAVRQMCACGFAEGGHRAHLCRAVQPQPRVLSRAREKRLPARGDKAPERIQARQAAGQRAVCSGAVGVSISNDVQVSTTRGCLHSTVALLCGTADSVWNGTPMPCWEGVQFPSMAGSSGRCGHCMEEGQVTGRARLR